MRLPKPDTSWLVPVLIVLAGVLLYRLDPLPLQILRNDVFDQYQRWDARPYRPGPVRIIDIDDASLAKLGQWPWPRTWVADLILRLRAAGATVVAFDVIFSEPDRTSPAAMFKTWGTRPDACRPLVLLPDHDEQLARAIARGGVVLGHAPKEGGTMPANLARPFAIIDMGPPSLPYLHDFSGTVAALPALQRAAAGNGAIAFLSDPDGVIRRVPLLLRVGGQAVPSLVSEALRVSQDAKDYAVLTSDEAGAGLEEIVVGKLTVPSTAEGEVWVRYTHGGEARYLQAWRVLAGQIPAGSLRGDVVLVGTSAKGLLDLRHSPLGGIIPGVEVHALALEQILSGDTLERPNWARGLEACIIVVMGLLVGFVALSAGAVWSALIVALTLAATGWGGWWAYSRHGLLLDPVAPGLVVVLSFLLASLRHHIATERRQRWVRQAFARYVSPNLVRHIVENPGALELGGSRRECSFIFTDLAGFTSLMEKLDPVKAVTLLNAYLDNMIRIAFEHDGTLDRIVGDAVAIMFSAPIEQTDHRRRALRCAEAMHRFACQYAAAAKSNGVPFGLTRIGIHSGAVTVGNFGGSTIFDYRALGDPVNTASRLESVNKQLGTLVCVSQATLSGADETAARPVGRLVLKGKTEPLMVYEPRFAIRCDVPDPDLAYEAAYALMAADEDAARQTFEMLAEQRPDDPLTQFHARRLRTGPTGDLIVFTEK